MNKLKDYWRRWCLCYRENGLKYTIKKTFRRIGERRVRKKAEKLGLNNINNSTVNKANPVSTPVLNPAEDKLHLSRKKINVGFLLVGGLGDLVIGANYVYKFRQKFNDENLRLDIFVRNINGSSKVVFYEGYVFDHLYSEDLSKNRVKDYDIFIELVRYPDIKRRNLPKINSMMPELVEYISLCERFRYENPRYFSISSRNTDCQAAVLNIIEGKKRIQQPDIYNYFGLTEKYEYQIPIMEDEIEYLKDMDLYGKKFITLNRGVDTNNNKVSVKMWPLQYYNVLTKMLKDKYPDIILVQVGASYDKCPPFENIDLQLVGKTNLEQLKVLLKHSLIHIDGEGGMPHVRHALSGGESVIMFGPTSADFYGYSENENLVGNGCDIWCEWVVEEWQQQCLRGYKVAPCMASITPEMVIKAVDRILEKENKE